MIMVQPRDQFRYGYRLWLDEETAMPLKSQLCDRDGKVIEQILFAELNLRDRIPADELKPAVSGEGFHWLRQDVQPRVRSPAASRGWNVIRLPAGFRLTTWRIRSSPGPARRCSTWCIRTAWLRCRCSSSRAIRRRSRCAVWREVGAAFAYSRASTAR